MSWFSRQPIAVKGLAVVAGVLMVSGVAAGASAAGTAPDPVREFFGFEANSSIRVQFTGVIRGIDAANGALTVEAGTDVRTVIVDSATELEDDDDRDMAFEDLAVGDIVEVRGSLQPDNTILADHVERDDDDDDFGTPVGTPFDPTPADAQVTPQPTFDDDDDDRDDDDGNSGPGNGDDASNDDDDDNSGPGSGDDDDGHDDDDDNSGPGSGDDGHGDDDNSGPGNGDDDDDDQDDDSDNSGPGNGDDDDDDRDDDNSGSGSGDDDDDDGGDDDDDDNSGSGGGDDDDDDD
jgi:hypothetical protein